MIKKKFEIGAKTVEVKIGEPGFLKKEIEEMRRFNKKVLLIAQSGIPKQIIEKIGFGINESECGLGFEAIPLEEEDKNLKTLEKVYRAFMDHDVNRETLVLAIGGGAASDLCGFAASTYMRGVRLSIAPTTLLSMVDASIGGKTGVDFMGAKNMIGTFYQPEMVIMDISFAESLSEERMMEGLSEIIKYFLIDEVGISTGMGELFERSSKNMAELISKCVEIKMNIVANDEYDKKDRRAVLNYGHTFGHAIEKESGFAVSHGIAVLAGMVCAARLGEIVGISRFGLCEDHVRIIREAADRFCGEKSLERVLKKFNFPEPSGIVDAMRFDKKKKEIEERVFVVLEEIGKPTVKAINAEDEVLEECIEYAYERLKVY